MIVDKVAMTSFLLRKYKEATEEEQNEFALCSKDVTGNNTVLEYLP